MAETVSEREWKKIYKGNLLTLLLLLTKSLARSLAHTPVYKYYFILGINKKLTFKQER